LPTELGFKFDIMAEEVVAVTLMPQELQRDSRISALEAELQVASFNGSN
jgi:hypothetical protein